VAAQEIEVPIEDVCSGSGADDDLVALYFATDLTGYGWFFRKQAYVNVGFGQYEGECVRHAVDRFVHFLADRGMVRRDAAWRWKGHAYRLSSDRRSRLVDDHVMLIGDAAGLAYRESGEGIRPAVESGLLAAATIVEANGRFDREQLTRYERRLDERFGASASASSAAASSALKRLASRLSVTLAPRLVDSPWLVRHVMLDRWFLHAAQPALAAC
jgi:flavin-dependent dehydrogenase